MALSCAHLSEYKTSRGLKPFQTIYFYFFSCSTSRARAVKAEYWKCMSCDSCAPRLHCCLYCVHFACNVHKHIHKHFAESEHGLAVDLTVGSVYCFLCKKFVYDTDVESVARAKADEAWRRTGLGGIQHIYWEPTKEELDLLRKYSKRRKVSSMSTLGLRGLHNLGNTCFMNCIIQALVHSPMLRNYFLADLHVCHMSTDKQNKSQCLVCELSVLFQEFYNGECSPYIPYRFLHLVWQNARHLAGYEQQDAHEFLMAALDILHQHSRNGVNGISNGEGEGSSESIIECLCTGDLQSDVICQQCRSVSTTVDPFWDISLDLGNIPVVSRNVSKMTATATISSPTKSSPTPFAFGSSASSGKCSVSAPPVLSPTSRIPNTLLECLERFTHPERLGSEALIKCRTCGTYQESTKQLTMKKVPTVVCFHFKRFEHGKTSRKISRFILFPLEIDMTPFMSPRDADTKCTLHDNHNRYSLFAVVNHSGTMDTGHYTCYVRHNKDQWYKCDDPWITKANTSDVLHSEAYLLFYHKKILEYE
ncbi:ubiquitin carboxyl-terminal hydrolase 22-like isoform X2 [Corticium candelabrum]|uniref:ubiquitin carboxyl-terminal hydrolase 22-like isoform X2 n=1 Tax=Corticium candelabrum TaxID=121492 RepID=UPI002E310E5B|nr:ubiquitin carboxyl-terminal hydrolase 22-like isoform X2 [Corticium candelabrum]